MNDKQSNENKWKDFLLKTSLPLEQIVSEKIEQHSFYVAGEYPYTRPNEHNINTEFSIDLHARQSFMSSSAKDDSEKYFTSLNLLIECKYNYPGVKWIFSSNTRNLHKYQTIFALTNQKKKLYSHSFPFSICTRGIELHNTGFDPNSITHGLNQLRYGMPNLILQESKYIMHDSEARYIRNKENELEKISYKQAFICLVLVSTASLYVLKPQQTLETYQLATSLEDLASPVSALIMAQDRGPHLQLYSENLVVPVKERAIRITTGKKDYIQKETDEIIPKVFPVFIVNISAFDDFIVSLVSFIKTKLGSDILSPDEFS